MVSVLKVGVLTLVTLFTVGWLGSIVVVVISGFEDLKTVFSKDERPEHHQPIES